MTSRAAPRPVGTVTRGTTNPNRLRRMDRWIAQLPQLRRASRVRRRSVPVAEWWASAARKRIAEKKEAARLQGGDYNQNNGPYTQSGGGNHTQGSGVFPIPATPVHVPGVGPSTITNSISGSAHSIEL